MQLLLEKSGSQVCLGPEIGCGGQGTLRQLDTDHFVAKTGNIDEAKLRYLAAHPVIPSANGYSFAWPYDVLVDPGTQQLAGYVMPRVQDGTDVIGLYSASWLPDSFRTRVSLNHIRAMMDLELAGFRVGDLPNSIVHNRQGEITLIDIDSLQVSRSDAQFNCGCVKLDTIPPELIELFRAANGDDYETTREHDAWSVAVVIWQIYFAGEHPFDFRWVGTGPRLKRTEVVELGWWPHSRAYPDVEPRRGIRPFVKLDLELQSLFRRTFDDGHSQRNPTMRPQLREWEAVLSRMKDQGK